MAQSYNPEGVKFFFKTLVEPNLIIPHIQVKDINGLNPELLKEAGVKGVVFDKDNTLTEYHSNRLHPRIYDSLEKFRSAFETKDLAILSNSAGTPDDPDLKEAKSLENHLGIPVIRHNKKKPAGGEETANHFGYEPQSILIVGDRILTDIAFGNRYGMITALVKPLNWIRDNKMAMLCRPFENVALWCLERPLYKYSAPKNTISEKYQELMKE